MGERYHPEDLTDQQKIDRSVAYLAGSRSISWTLSNRRVLGELIEQIKAGMLARQITPKGIQPRPLHRIDFTPDTADEVIAELRDKFPNLRNRMTQNYEGTVFVITVPRSLHGSDFSPVASVIKYESSIVVLDGPVERYDESVQKAVGEHTWINISFD